jgi:hypothetical protein
MSERLTYHYGENNEHADFITIKKDGYARYRASCEGALKLAAYEDSGLSPEEVQELAKAKADGRLVVLPCKVGDTVYEANKNRNIVSTYRVTHITIMTGSINYGWELLEGIYSNLNGFNEHALGKTVFLSREEAEKALEVGNP